ncbi:MAG: hypothetical protein FJZ01_03695 [Candidatus Sericytochromatia bacterium]|nr:hypothetical protein [Candidatus Tanganyikabacteria bacterium]
MTYRDFLTACAGRALAAADDALPAGLETPREEALALAAEWREACAELDSPGDADEYMEAARTHAIRCAAEVLAVATDPAPTPADVARARDAACAAAAHAAEVAAWETAQEGEADPWVSVLDRVDDLRCDKGEYRQWLAALDVARVAITDAAAGEVDAVRADRISWWDRIRGAGEKARAKVADRRAEPGAAARVWDAVDRALEGLAKLDPAALRLDDPGDPQIPPILLAALAAGEIARLAEQERQEADLARS